MTIFVDLLCNTIEHFFRNEENLETHQVKTIFNKIVSDIVSPLQFVVCELSSHDCLPFHD